MAVSEKSLQNLQPPKNGEVRNPNGRPKGALSAKTVIRRWLEAKDKIEHPVTKKQMNATMMDAIILEQLKKAKNGDVSAFNALLDRMEGKPAQENVFTGELNNNVTLRVIRE